MKINDKINYQKLYNNITMNNLKSILEIKNISITKIATNGEIILTESSIQSYINGQKKPSLTTLINIANYLDCNIDFLLDRTDNPININSLNKLNTDKDLGLLFETIKSLPKSKQNRVTGYVRALMDDNYHIK
jgi:transcriptional regulator with XRE-family HTH domain